jgi:hypothetical protein
MTHPHRKMVRIDCKGGTLVIRKMAVQAAFVEEQHDGRYWLLVYTAEKGLGPFTLAMDTRDEVSAALALLEDDTAEPEPVSARDVGNATPTLSPRKGTAGEVDWQTESYEDWCRANEIITSALAEWFGAARVEGGGYGSAIQARLAQAKPSLMITRSSRINYMEKSCG